MTAKMNFEESMKALEAIVQRLESGECTLDESIELFEKGMKLSGDCAGRLETAKQKIISLTEAEKEGSEND